MCFLSFKNILFYKNFECKNKQIKMKIKLLMLISVLLLISANCFSQEEVKQHFPNLLNSIENRVAQNQAAAQGICGEPQKLDH